MPEDNTKQTEPQGPSTETRDPQYFAYYAMLQHQQNMLQDSVRTSTYRSAILLNGPACFQDKVVMDVGAGSGILSYFSVQAGAKKVYAVEASNMASKMRKIVEAAKTHGKNAFLKDKIEVIQSKIEEPNLPIPQVDTIISEPIGVLLVHERMLESFIHARDHYLKPGGALFPSKGVLFLAPFTDAGLWSETMGKARFWEQQAFYGVDLTTLYLDARDEMFSMPVVGHFDHRSLLYTPSSSSGYDVDFTTISLQELQDFTVPISWSLLYTGLIHGVAGWFDLAFIPPVAPPTTPPGAYVEMSTGPAAERTHWQQVRFLFKEPLGVNAGQRIQGWMRCVVNDMRSYTVTVELVVSEMGVELADPASATAEDGDAQVPHPLRRRGTWQLHEQTYNYNYAPAFAGQDYRPEYSCLYVPEQQQVATSLMTAPPPPPGIAETGVVVDVSQLGTFDAADFWLNKG